MSNIGKKVRILDSYDTPASKSYIGQIGTIISDKSDNDYYVIQMIDGRKLMPFRENYTEPQYELIADEPVNDKWYVRCIDAKGTATGLLKLDAEYEVIGERSKGEEWLIVNGDDWENSWYKKRFTPKYQKQQAMNTDINEQIAALEKQINELKEQVNNPYKAGDWIWLDNKEYSSYGTAQQISKIDKQYPDRLYLLEYGWWDRSKCRLATQKEIDSAIAAQVPKEKIVEIGSERTKITVKKGQIIGPDNKTVGIDAVKYLYRELKDATEAINIPWPISEISCKIGCAEKVSIAQLRSVIEEYDKINKL